MFARTGFRSLLAGGLVALIGAGVYFASTSFAQGQWRNVISGDRFDLVDFRGVPRARLGLSGGDQSYTYFYLMDSSGRNRVEIVVSPGSQRPEIKLLNTRGELVSDLSSGVQSVRPDLPPLPYVAAPGGKADSADARDIQNLQHQIDVLRSELNGVIKRVNIVSD